VSHPVPPSVLGLRFTAVDARTEELRSAHDVLAEFYVELLGADPLSGLPVGRAVLDLFCELTITAGRGTRVGDIGCGTGHLAPYLAGQGLSPHGIDLAPEMVAVARRDHPGFVFDVADLRELPFEDGSLAGAVCWYSLMFLPPEDRPAAFAELARVVAPGGYLVTGFKAGDGQLRRAGRSTGLDVEFDIYWLSPEEMQQRLADAGYAPVFWAGRPAGELDNQPQAYLIARKP
jgi:ubiquinone/menaquinone biosynthesis C-methylase UbiE